MKISNNTGQIQRQNIIPETPKNNRNKLKKLTQSDYGTDAPWAHNPDLVCDLATRQSHPLTNEQAYLLTIVPAGVKEHFTV